MKKTDMFGYAMLFFLALCLRLFLFGYLSYAYVHFLKGWYLILATHPGLSAFASPFSDYAPLYLYALKFLTVFCKDSLFAIKVFSVMFDFILAFAVYKILHLKFPGSRIPIAGALVLLFVPSVIINSAYAAQCDAIYTTAVMFSLYSLLKDRPKSAMLFFSLAFSLKLQAIFFLPVIIISWIKRKYNLWHFLMIPATYAIAAIPAWIGGASISNLISVYWHQAGEYHLLSSYIPNIYVVLPTYLLPTEAFIAGGVVCAGLFMLSALIIVQRSRQELTYERTVLLSMFCAVILPLVLPLMHERYYYIAEVLAVIYAFARPQRWHVSLIVIVSSFIGYSVFFARPQFPLVPAAFAMIAAAILLSVDLVREFPRTPKASDA